MTTWSKVPCYVCLLNGKMPQGWRPVPELTEVDREPLRPRISGRAK